MKKFAMIVLSVLMCILCFGCAAKAPEPAADAGLSSGTVAVDPYESISDPSQTPAFIFMASLGGLIAVSATVVLIHNARRKTNE